MSATRKDVLVDVDNTRRANDVLYEDNLYYTLRLNAHVASTPEERDRMQKEALLAEYVRLRNQEYEMTVQNEALKLYNVSRDTRNVNRDYWRGLPNTPGAENTAAAMAPKMTTYRPDGGDATCAITASSLTAQINNKINEGCPDCANPGKPLITPNHSGVNSGQGFTNSPGAKDYKWSGSKTLNQLIVSGELDVGDAVSFRIRPATKKRSGCHAMVITDVTRDPKGNVTSYTIQGNNETNLITYKRIPGTNNFKGDNNRDYGNTKVESAIETHKWMENQISKEREALSQLSVEELLAQVEATRDRVAGTYNEATKQREGGLMGELATTEMTNFNKGYNRKIGAAYELEKNLLEVENLAALSDREQIAVQAMNTNDVDLLGRMGKIDPEKPDISQVQLEGVEEYNGPSIGEVSAARVEVDASQQQKPKNNIFKKAGKWISKASKDTANWCVGAFNTVTGKKKNKKAKEDETTVVTPAQEEVKVDNVVVTAGAASASVNDQLQQVEQTLREAGFNVERVNMTDVPTASSGVEVTSEPVQASPVVSSGVEVTSEPLQNTEGTKPFPYIKAEDLLKKSSRLKKTPVQDRPKEKPVTTTEAVNDYMKKVAAAINAQEGVHAEFVDPKDLPSIRTPGIRAEVHTTTDENGMFHSFFRAPTSTEGTTKDVMTAQAEMANKLLLDPESLLGEFISAGETKDAMQDDQALLVQALGMLMGDENALSAQNVPENKGLSTAQFSMIRSGCYNRG